MVLSKTWSILRWVLVMIVNFLFVISSYFMYPIAYLLRKHVRRYKNNTIVKFLWFYLDDTDGDYGAEYWLRDKPKNFKTAYKWSVLRNPAWNLQESLRPIKGDHKLISYSGYLNQGVFDPFELAKLKYVDNYGAYSDNKGEYLSLYYSTIGKMFIWYKVGDRLYWRYSFANQIKWYKGLWIEFQIGTTYRYTFRLKFKIPKVYEWDTSEIT